MRVVSLLIVAVVVCAACSRDSEGVFANDQALASELLRDNREDTPQRIASLAAKHQDDPYRRRYFELLAIEALTERGDYAQADRRLREIDLSFDQGEALAPRLLYLQALIASAEEKPGRAKNLAHQAYQLAVQHERHDVSCKALIFLSDSGDLENAVTMLQLAKPHAAASEDPYLQSLVAAYLGFALTQQSRYEEILKTLANPSLHRPEAARFLRYNLLNLGLSYSYLGFFEQAEDRLRQAIALFKEQEEPVGVQAATGELGNVWHYQGDYEKASVYYEQAYSLAAAHYPEHCRLWAQNAAAALIELELWDRAEAWNQKAQQAKEDGRPDLTVQFTLNQAIIALGRGRLDRAETLFSQVVAAEQHHKDHLWEAHAGLAKLWTLRGDEPRARAEFERAIALIESQTGSVAHKNQPAFFSRVIRFYDEYLAFLTARGQPMAALAAADGAHARTLKDRLSDSATWTAGLDIDRLADRAKGSRIAFLAYWLGQDRSYAWVISPLGAKMAVLPPRAQIAAAVKAYGAAIQQDVHPLAEEQADGRWLYKNLLEPIRDLLIPGGRVYLSPDRELCYLNFETLPVYDGGAPRFWIEDAVVSVVPSLSVAPKDLDTPLDLPTALLVGYPEEVTAEFYELPNSETELALIRETLPETQFATLLRAKANPRAVKASLGRDHALIHFAAHAVASTREPLSSFIALSSPTGDQRDYLLFAHDVAEFELATELVTLSACQSAGARAYAGEGLVGFAWTFLYAGARRVVAGLWQVEDRFAKTLMGEFYRGLAKGAPADEALRAAKLKFIGSDSQINPLPRIWAPFQLFIGSGSQVMGQKTPPGEPYQQ